MREPLQGLLTPDQRSKQPMPDPNIAQPRDSPPRIQIADKFRQRLELILRGNLIDIDTARLPAIEQTGFPRHVRHYVRSQGHASP